MDKTTLVRTDEELEGRIMEALSRIKMPITLLRWTFAPEVDEWRLIIATPWYDQKGPLATIRAAFDAFQEAGIYEDIPIRRVFFKSPNDSVVRTLEQESSEESEGTLHLLRQGGAHDPGEYSVVFAPFVGPGGAVPARRFSRIDELRHILVRTLRIRPRAVDEALEELAQRGSVSIRPVSLKARELKKAGLA